MDVKKLGAFDTLQLSSSGLDGRFPLEREHVRPGVRGRFNVQPGSKPVIPKADVSVGDEPLKMSREQALREGLVPVTEAEYQALQRMTPVERARFAKTLLRRQKEELLAPARELEKVHPAALLDTKARNRRKAKRRSRR